MPRASSCRHSSTSKRRILSLCLLRCLVSSSWAWKDADKRSPKSQKANVEYSQLLFCSYNEYLLSNYSLLNTFLDRQQNIEQQRDVPGRNRACLERDGETENKSTSQLLMQIGKNLYQSSVSCSIMSESL